MRTIDELAADVIAAARAKRVTLGTAESLTGGMIAAALVGVSGASEVLEGGVTSYSNAVKHRVLRVSARTLRSPGPVSHECARAMARGARRRLRCMAAVSATGIAGPTGGTPETPVGTYFIGGATARDCLSREHHAEGDRQAVRESAVRDALALLLQLIDNA